MITAVKKPVIAMILTINIITLKNIMMNKAFIQEVGYGNHTYQLDFFNFCFVMGKVYWLMRLVDEDLEKYSSIYIFPILKTNITLLKFFSDCRYLSKYGITK